MENRVAGQFQPVAKAILMPLCRFAWRLRVEGAENVPRSGAAVLAPNHLSALDSLFVPMALKRRITYVGKAEYLDQWRAARRSPLGMVPIDRSGGDSAQAALDTAANILESGELFGIYPEGTRSRDGLLHKGKTGIARLALRTGAPIVPVGVLGALKVQPPEKRFPSPFHTVTVKFGEPIDVSRYADRASDRLVLRQITDEVMYSIRELTGQDYEHTYAGKATEKSASVQAPIKAAEIEIPEPAVSPSSAQRSVNAKKQPASPSASVAEEPAVSSADVLRSNEAVELVQLG